MNFIILGLDVSAHKADIVWLDAQLEIPLRDFYESSAFEQCHAELDKSAHSIKFIQSLNPAVCILEPTGVYSRFWIDEFNRLGIKYLLCNQTVVADTRKALGGSSNKDDPFDALIMIELYYEKYLNRYDRRFWIRSRGETIAQISRLLNEINGVTKRRTQAINGAKQRLSFEFPAKAKVKSARRNGRLNPDILPAWWAWCCGWTETPTWELRKREATKFNNEYQRAMERHEGTGISQLTREYAKSVCHWHICEAMLEREFLPLLDDEDFADYHRIFDEFGFGERERGWLLTRIYPFDNFLGIPRFRSKRRFRQALGCGKITSQSGQSSSTSKKSAGAAQIHAVLHCYVSRQVEIGMGQRLISPEIPKLNNKDSLPKTRVCSEVRAYFIKRAFNLETLQKKSKVQLIGARSATARKLAEVLFNRLYADWTTKF